MQKRDAVPFDWLKGFLHDMPKKPDYAEKTLAAYRLGIKAGGYIRGVRIVIDTDGCEACRALDTSIEYSPDDAPHLPLIDCTKGLHCRCVYRPAMTFEPESE